MTSGDHGPGGRVRQYEDRPAQHVEQPQLVVDVVVEDPSAEREPGVVDEQADGPIGVGHPLRHRLDLGRVGQVRHEHLGLHPVTAPQLVGEALQPGAVASDQHQVVSSTRQLAGEGETNPRRRTGDQSGSHTSHPTGRVSALS